MTYEEMQDRFICPNQDTYNWFYCGFENKTDLVSVWNLVDETYSPDKLFIHQVMQSYFIGVDQNTTIADDFGSFVVLVDSPVVEEGGE